MFSFSQAFKILVLPSSPRSSSSFQHENSAFQDTYRKAHSGLSLCLHHRDIVTAPMVLFCSLLRTDMSSHCLDSKTAASATVVFYSRTYLLGFGTGLATSSKLTIVLEQKQSLFPQTCKRYSRNMLLIYSFSHALFSSVYVFLLTVS